MLVRSCVCDKVLLVSELEKKKKPNIYIFQPEYSKRSRGTYLYLDLMALTIKVQPFHKELYDKPDLAQQSLKAYPIYRHLQLKDGRVTKRFTYFFKDSVDIHISYRVYISLEVFMFKCANQKYTQFTLLTTLKVCTIKFLYYHCQYNYGKCKRCTVLSMYNHQFLSFSCFTLGNKQRSGLQSAIRSHLVHPLPTQLGLVTFACFCLSLPFPHL